MWYAITDNSKEVIAQSESIIECSKIAFEIMPYNEGPAPYYLTNIEQKEIKNEKQ